MEKIKKSLLIVLLAFLSFNMQAEVPQCKLTDLNNRTVVTSDISESGKVTVISFFALWCKPCLRELSAIHQVYPDWEDEVDFDFIAVSIDAAQDRNKVQSLANGSGWEFSVWLDPAGEFKRAMNVSMIPAIFIVDKEGKIAYSHTGYVDGSEAKLFEKVKELASK